MTRTVVFVLLTVCVGVLVVYFSTFIFHMDDEIGKIFVSKFHEYFLLPCIVCFGLSALLAANDRRFHERNRVWQSFVVIALAYFFFPVVCCAWLFMVMEDPADGYLRKDMARAFLAVTTSLFSLSLGLIAFIPAWLSEYLIVRFVRRLWPSAKLLGDVP